MAYYQGSKTFGFELVTPEACRFEGAVKEVVFQAYNGQMALMPGHVNTLTMGEPGLLKVIEPDNKAHVFAVGSGFVIDTDDKATCLVDFALAQSDVELEKEEAALAELMKEVEQRGGDSDFRLEERALRAKIRVGKGI